MDLKRFRSLTGRYGDLRIAVLGDFCLDRYLEIDPARREVSIETGLPVHNVVNVRSQPGAAGTILNNLSALGIGSIFPIGFLGEDGEGYELSRALASLPGVRLDGMVTTSERRTFTYCKPLLMVAGKLPEELNRLDSKNWTATPARVAAQLGKNFERIAAASDAVIVLDQVDLPETGVVTRQVLKLVRRVAEKKPDLFILGDSRRGLSDFPPVVFKMNAAELGRLRGMTGAQTLEGTKGAALDLAKVNRRMVFVTLAEQGIVGAEPEGTLEHLQALPLRGPIDVVGAGDAVSANLTSAIAAGANLREAITVANAAASVVLHKLGTTGTASVSEIGSLLFAQ